MNAIFKTKDRILITGSDKDEKILIKSFVENVKDKIFVYSFQILPLKPQLH